MHLDAPSGAAADRVEVASRVARALNDPAWTPPVLPTTAMQLLEMSRRPNASVNDIARMLLLDPNLVGRLMQRANSSASGGAAPCQTVRDAVTRLGLVGVTNLALEVALGGRVFRVAAYQSTADALRRHCVATAYLTAMVCQAASVNDPHAFLCGMFADVGIALGLVALAETTPYEERLELAALWPPLVEVHPRLSARLATAWGLGAGVARVIANHHVRPSDGKALPTSAAVAVAARLAGELGAPAPAPAPTPTSDDERHFVWACDTLALSPLKLDQIRVAGARQIEALAM